MQKVSEKCHIPSGRIVDGAAVVVRFVGDPVFGEVTDGSGVGLLSVSGEVIIGCAYDNCKRFYPISES